MIPILKLTRLPGKRPWKLARIEPSLVIPCEIVDVASKATPGKSHRVEETFSNGVFSAICQGLIHRT